MYRWGKWVVLAAMALALATANAWADKIYLKNGRVVEGDIYAESSYDIKVKVNGIPTTFFRYEIDHIEKTSAASGAAGGEEQAVTPEKKELVKRFLEANGTRDAMSRIFAQIIKKAPADAQEKLRAEMNVDGVIDRLVPLYAKHFTADELKQLITFYRSPVGTKLQNVMPDLMQESMAVAAKYFEEQVKKGQPSK